MDTLPPDAPMLAAYGEDAAEPLDDPARGPRAVAVGLLLAVPLWVVIAAVTWIVLRAA